MAIDWQNIMALTAVAVAAAYLARQVWTQLAGHRPATGCTNCTSCRGRGSPGQEGVQLVPLTPLSTKRRDDD